MWWSNSSNFEEKICRPKILKIRLSPLVRKFLSSDPLEMWILKVKNRHKSTVFWLNWTKLGKNVKTKSKIIFVFFFTFWPPLWRHNGGQKVKNRTKIACLWPEMDKIWQKCKNKVKHFFGHFWSNFTPSMTSLGRAKYPKKGKKNDKNRSFFGQIRQNLAEVLRQSQHFFGRFNTGFNSSMMS